MYHMSSRPISEICELIYAGLIIKDNGLGRTGHIAPLTPSTIVHFDVAGLESGFSIWQLSTPSLLEQIESLCITARNIPPCFDATESIFYKYLFEAEFDNS